MLKNQMLFYYAIGICMIMGITFVFLSLAPPLAPAVSDTSADDICRQHLKSLGYEAGDLIERCEVVIPALFDKTYQKYNELQKQAGMDLKKYRGQKVMRYTYSITNYPENIEGVRANLLYYDEKIIGGDICTVAIDGFMVPLLPIQN